MLWVERKLNHEWPTTRSQAIERQQILSQAIELHGNSREPNVIAAVDTAYGVGGERLYAAAVSFTFPALEQIEWAVARGRVTFPYHPGLFYFREGPVVCDALSKLRESPDLLIVHGHGTAHPKQCGAACMLGVVYHLPTIGCARRLLIGNHREVGRDKGAQQSIRLAGREVGKALRTKSGVKPLFVSPGHLCDLPFAVDIVLRCLRGYRLPEPLRLAHLLANKNKRILEKGRSSPDTASTEQS
jgi:deoxyribonuclease V